jgi:general secretion pathway protein L
MISGGGGIWEPLAGKPISWWVSALRGCLPARIRRLISGRQARLVVAIHEGSAFVSLVDGDETTNVRSIALDALARDGLPSDYRPRFHLLELRLGSDDVLSQIARLPLETEKNIERVVTVELDRITPFSAQDIYYDYRVKSRDVARAQLELELVMAPRANVSEGLAILEKTVAKPEVLTVEGGWRDINLLPAHARSKRRSGGRVAAFLAMLMCLLAIVALVIPLTKKRELLGEIGEQLADARKQAAVVMQISEQRDARKAEANYVVGKQRSANPKVMVIDELTRLLPDDTWVQYLEVKGDSLRVRGESEQASALIAQLESSPLFENTHFESPVVQVSRTGGERFHVAARILAPEKSW